MVKITSECLELIFKVLLLFVGWKPAKAYSSITRCCWSLVFCLASWATGLGVLIVPFTLPVWLVVAAGYISVLTYWYGFWMVIFLVVGIMTAIIQGIEPVQPGAAFSWQLEDQIANCFRMCWAVGAAVVAIVVAWMLLQSGSAIAAMAICVAVPCSFAAFAATIFFFIGVGNAAFAALRHNPLDSWRLGS